MSFTAPNSKNIPPDLKDGDRGPFSNQFSGGFSERWGNQAVERWKTRLWRQWRWCREVSSVLQSSLSTSPAPFNRRFHRPQSQSNSDFKIRTNQVTNTQSSLSILQSQSIDDSIRNQWTIPIEFSNPNPNQFSGFSNGVFIGRTGKSRHKDRTPNRRSNYGRNFQRTCSTIASIGLQEVTGFHCFHCFHCSKVNFDF
ncbi:hypothetical protein LXL04_032990 [Taraxacum kok-saghyz]